MKLIYWLDAQQLKKDRQALPRWVFPISV
jgi:hypothetical protein